jgi:hypothetical protein
MAILSLVSGIIFFFMKVPHPQRRIKMLTEQEQAHIIEAFDQVSGSGLSAEQATNISME